MSDEDTTLNEDSVQETQDTVDWQKRFTDTQAEYTKQQQALKDAQSVWEDEQALLARIGEKFPHLIADDETVDEDDSSFVDDTPEVRPDPRVDQHDQMLAEIAYERDLNQILAGRDLSEQGRAIVDALTLKGGNSKKALELAVGTWFDINPPVEEEAPKGKRAPHVPSGGRAATGVPNYSEMTRDQVEQAMLERARALEAQ